MELCPDNDIVMDILAAAVVVQEFQAQVSADRRVVALFAVVIILNVCAATEVFNQLLRWSQVPKAVVVDGVRSSLYICNPMCAGSAGIVQVDDGRFVAMRFDVGQFCSHKHTSKMGNLERLLCILVQIDVGQRSFR